MSTRREVAAALAGVVVSLLAVALPEVHLEGALDVALMACVFGPGVLAVVARGGRQYD